MSVTSRAILHMVSFAAPHKQPSLIQKYCISTSANCFLMCKPCRRCTSFSQPVPSMPAICAASSAISVARFSEGTSAAKLLCIENMASLVIDCGIMSSRMLPTARSMLSAILRSASLLWSKYFFFSASVYFLCGSSHACISKNAALSC